MFSRQFKTLGRHSVIYGLSNAMAASAGLVMLPLLTHFLSPQQYGTLELLTVFVVQVGVFLQLGLGSALFKSVLHDRESAADRRVVISTAFYTTVGIASVVALALQPAAPTLAKLLLGSAASGSLVGWILLKALFDAVSVVPMVRLRMREQARLYAVLSGGRLLVSLALIATALAVFDAGLPGVVVAMVLESALFAAVTVVTAREDLARQFSVPALRDMLKFGVPLIPFAFLLTVIALGDRYLLRIFGDLADIGRYAVGYKIAASLGVATRAFQVAWPTMLFSMAKTPDGEKFYAKLLTYFLVVLGLCGVVVSAFARDIIQLFTSSAFTGGYVVVPVLVLAQLGLGAFYVTAVGTNLAGKTHLQTVSALVAAAVFGVAGVALVPAFGMVGAASATALGYLTLAAVNCRFSMQLRPINYEWRRIGKLAALIGVLLVAGAFLRTGNRWADVAIRLIVVASYPALVYALRILSSDERAAVRLRAARIAARLFLPVAAPPFDAGRTERVLIYGGMGIGNLIMYTPALRVLRDSMPRARVTLLTGASGADQVVAGSDLVDDIVYVPGSLAGRVRLALRLRRLRYEVLLASFQGDDFKLITLLTGVPRRVGHATSPGWTGRADFLYNVPVQMAEDEHEVDRKLRLVRALGLHSPDGAPVFHVGETDRTAAHGFLVANGVEQNDRLVGVAIDVSRTQEWKRWHPERLAIVCNELSRHPGVKIVLMGAADRVDEVAVFRRMLEFDPIVSIGRTTLKQSAAILERCALAVVADSGAMHVSAAVGTPTLAVYGPTDYRRTSPLRYGSEHRVVRKPVECGPCFLMGGDEVVRACDHHKCLSLISAAEVVQAAEEMLGLRRARQGLRVLGEVETLRR